MKRSGSGALAAASFALALVLVGCGGGNQANPTTSVATTIEAAPTTTETTSAPPSRTVTIIVERASPRGGIQRPVIEEGERVVLVVRSDVADEVHVHGYDLFREVAPGGTARITFTATILGRFEVELEDRGVQIAELTVEP